MCAGSQKENIAFAAFFLTYKNERLIEFSWSHQQKNATILLLNIKIDI